MKRTLDCALTFSQGIVTILAMTMVIHNAAPSQSLSWQSLNGPEGGVCQCFAIDNQGNILTGTYFGGVYKTTNRGVSWARVSYGNWDIRTILVNANGHMFVGAANSGVWRSTDGGATWVQPTNIMNGRTVTSLALSLAGHLFAGCASTASQTVYRSTDNGETFELVSSLVLSANSVIHGEGNSMYTGGDRFGVIRSTDGGALWTRINPSSADFNGVSMTANVNYVYVVGRRYATTTPDSSFIYRRSVTTGNWELVRTQSNVKLRSISASGDTILAAGDSVALFSFDGGTTWIDGSLDAPASKVGKPIITCLSTPDVSFLGTAGGAAFRSINSGANWLNAKTGIYNTHITGIGITANGIIASTQFDGVHTCIDGVNWSSGGAGLPINDVATTIEVISQSGNTAFVGTTNNGLYRTIDGGNTFSRALYGTGASGIMDILTRSNGTVYAGGAGPNVHKSTTMGMTWGFSPLSISSTNVRGIEETTNGDLYAFTGLFPGGPFGGDGVYKSLTGGQTWNYWALHFTSFIGSDRSSDNKMLGAADQNVVFENDGISTSWSSSPSLSIGVKIRYARFYEHTSEPLRELVGASDGLYHRRAFTADPWVKNSLFGSLEVSFLSVRNGGGMPGQIVLGTYGGGVFQSTGPLTSVGENQNIPEEFSLEQNYPNPFNPSTTIGYKIQERGFVSLKVFDLLGVEVASLANEVKEPGTYSVMLDGSQLSTGVYFYRLQAGLFFETKKLILLR